MLVDLSSDLLMPLGPPPQVVLDQRWIWQLLLCLLSLVFTLRLIGLDIAGALLTGLMLCFVIIMIRDGMQDLSKYALVYAVLCGLNFFFDLLPLVTELGGRISRTAEPGPGAVIDEGTRQDVYTLTTKVTPFFAWEEGIIYNAQSLSMILSPFCMALGAYLSIYAHGEIQRQIQGILAEDYEDFARALPRHQALLLQQQQAALGSLPTGPRNRGSGAAAGEGEPIRRPGDPTSARTTFERFSGTPHKLAI